MAPAEEIDLELEDNTDALFQGGVQCALHRCYSEQKSYREVVQSSWADGEIETKRAGRGGEEIKKETKLRPAEVARPDVAGRQPPAAPSGGAEPVPRRVRSPAVRLGARLRDVPHAPGLSTAAGRGGRAVLHGWRVVEFCCRMG